MTDLSTTIAPKSDQINADDLIAGPRTITITKVSADQSSAEQPINIWFEGDNGKPFKPCKSMRRVLVNVWGIDGTRYTGRSMALYRDPEVTWAGMKVGGIRISHMSHIDKPVTMALTANKQQRKPYKVLPLENVKEQQQQPRDDIDLSVIIPALEASADLGTKALQKAWGDLDKQERMAAKNQLDRLKKIAADADAEEEDPFAIDDEPKGRADEDHGNQHDGTDDKPSLAERMKAKQEVDESPFDQMIAQIVAIKSKAQLKQADNEFQLLAATFSDEQYQKIDDELNAARKRLGN